MNSRFVQANAQAIVLFAHGSKDPLWHAPIEAIRRRMGQLQPHLPVRCAYLELTEPDLTHCVAALIHEGAQHIRIVPLFLGMGRHAREDLPRLLTQLRATHANTRFEVLPALGEDPRLTELSCQIALGGLSD